MRELKFFMVMFLFITVFHSEIYAAQDISDADEIQNVEYETVCVDQLFNSRTTVSVMQIEGSGLDFSSAWEKHYFLYYSTDDVIVGEIVYGYNGSNQIYCKAYSNIYSHKAKIQIQNTVYTSSTAAAWKWATKTLTHSSGSNGSHHEFGIELSDAESGGEYYFQIVY